MAVPDTNTFTLQDVVDEIMPTTDDLVDCFADAISGNFDASYSGSKNNLLNFRNYGDTSVYPVSVSPTGRSDSSSSCGDTASVTRYSSAEVISYGNIIYEDSEGITVFNGGGKWFKFGTDRAFIISSRGVLGTGTFCI